MARPVVLLVLVIMCSWTAAASAQEIVVKTPDSSLEDFDGLWDYSDPAESEERFRALLPDANATEHLPTRIEILTQVARAEGLQRKFEEAQATLDEAEALLTGETKVGRIANGL